MQAAVGRDVVIILMVLVVFDVLPRESLNVVQIALD
jgi:hypothetical protein